MFLNIFPFFFLLLLSVQGKLLKQIKWLDNSTSQVHQVVLLITGDKNNVDPRLEEIVQGIDRNIPILNYRLHDVKLMQKLKHSNDPQSSIFIIIHQGQGNKNLSDASLPINFINELPKFHSRPKCLVILLGQVKSLIYKNFFQNMWAKQFLDVTILEIVTQKQEKNSLFLNNRREIVRIQNYNPFTETVKMDKYRSAAPLFPEKLENLQGYQLKVGFYNFMPEVFKTYDQSAGHATLSGFSWWKIETLSSKMNFKIAYVEWKKKGSLNCTHIEKSTGMFKNILNNEVDFSTVEFGRYYSCDEHLYVWSKGFTEIDLCLVVPFIEEESYSLTFSWKIFNLLAIVSLPILVWCVSHFFQFDTRNWRMTYITQIFLGSSVPREPQRLAERIIFIVLLITCFLNSSFIYTAITAIGLKKTSTMKYETVEDVLSHNIEINIGANVYDMLHPSMEGVTKLLLEKAKKIQHAHHLCEENFIRHKNIACVVSKENFEWRLRGKQDNCGKPVVKMLECLRKSPGYTVLATRSPYKKRVDTILQILLQSGIPRHWKDLFNKEQQESTTTLNSCKPKREESIKVLHQIFFILAFGYSCSTLAFIYELLVVCLFKRKASKFKISKYLRSDKR